MPRPSDASQQPDTRDQPVPVHRPDSVEQAAEIVRGSQRLQIHGAGTKPALAAVMERAESLTTASLAGISDYQPDEFLITALAGTPLKTLDAHLAQQGQYLPFDPPRVDAGATVGGTVAAGLSGPGRLKYGGLRDFLMGVRLIDGRGEIVTGGGRVVKNAAGYDLPKLLAGSCGRLGLIVEVTLKVFPRPDTTTTIRIRCGDFAAALALQSALARQPVDLTALDLTSDGCLEIRLSGSAEAVEATRQRVARATTKPLEVIDPDASHWQPLADWSYLEEDERLVRVPVAPRQVAQLEAELDEQSLRRRYSAAGNLAWVRWPGQRPIAALDELLRHQRLGGTVMTGRATRVRLGRRPDQTLMQRIKSALDPEHRFVGPS